MSLGGTMTPNSVFYGPIEMPPNLQINWSHRITNKTPEDFIILSSSGSLKIQILSPKKKKKRVELRYFNSSPLEIIKRACSIKDKRDFFHYPCNTHHRAPPLSSHFPPPSLSHTHTHTHTHTHMKKYMSRVPKKTLPSCGLKTLIKEIFEA